MYYHFAHSDASRSFSDSLNHFFQNPIAAFVLATAIALLFLMAALYVLKHYTRLTVTEPAEGKLKAVINKLHNTRKKRG